MESDDEENWLDTTWSQPNCQSNVPAACQKRTAEHAEQCGSITQGAVSSVLTPVPADQKAGKMPAAAQSGGGEAVLSRMQLNDNKAGMQGLDKEKINSIIHEISKGSKFYENEKKKEEQLNKKIEEQKKKILSVSQEQLSHGQAEGKRILQELQDSRDLTRTIVHVDMDAFYAAVEMKDNPSLKDKPMAVGSTGMLSTSNYYARKFGVRAAMPGFIGKKLCPHLIIVPPNFDKYTAVSREVREVFSEYDPHFCPMSLDEAYLDFTEHMEKRVTSLEKSRSFPAINNKSQLCQCKVGYQNYERKDGDNMTSSTAIDENIELKSIDHDVILTNVKNDSIDIVKEDSNTKHLIVDTLETSTSPPIRGSADNEEQNTGTVRDTCCVCGKLKSDEEEMITFGTTVEEAVREMRHRIEKKTRLTASAGIAPNMMLAKVCSDKNKPNGQYRIMPTIQAVMEFVRDLPIRKISGIGKVSEKLLSSLGIVKCSDICQQMGLLYYLYSPISFNYFLRVSIGIGSTTVERDGERKSMSVERTFSEINNPVELYRKCEELSESLSEDLKEEKLLGKTVTLKVKTVNFEVKTRAQTLLNFTDSAELIAASARDLLKGEIQACAPQPLRLRLMGVRMSNFVRQEQIRDQKQVTITGMLQKLHKKSRGQKIVSEVIRLDNNDILDSDSTECSLSIYNSPTKTKPADYQASRQDNNNNRSHLDGIWSNSVANRSESINSKLSLGNGVSDEAFKHSDDNVCKSHTEGSYSPSKIQQCCLSKGNNHTPSKMQSSLTLSPIPSSSKPPPKFLPGEQQSGLQSLDSSTSIDHSNVNQGSQRRTFSADKGVAVQADTASTGLHDTVLPRNDTAECTRYPKYTCPICNRTLSYPDQRSMNKHIDDCLEGKTCPNMEISVAGAVKEESVQNGSVDFHSSVGSKEVALDEKGHTTGMMETSAQVSEMRSEQNSTTDLLCPVCRTRKSYENFITFTEHVNNCLSDSAALSTQQKELSVTSTENGSAETTILDNNHSDILPNKTLSESDFSESEHSDEFQCPVCGHHQNCDNLDTFNKHVDACLSRSAIKSMLREENAQASQSLKRNMNESALPPSKKRKSQTSASCSRTIDTFFK